MEEHMVSGMNEEFEDDELEEVTTDDILDVQHLLAEGLKEEYGISSEEISDLFMKYDASRFIQINFWYLQSGGVIDLVDEYIKHIKMLGGTVEIFNKQQEY